MQSALWDLIISDAASKIHLTAKQLGLQKANKLSEEFMQKSRVEVREKQNEFMWLSFLKNMANKHSELFIEHKITAFQSYKEIPL